ncbi:HRDC domain-containing protein [Paenibacillus gansuensis]|uniref:HRDC domain-containing protein n=1 Tax=Paenibacillus gansuensis TaxID=306542 RepID=A0ABW5PFF9_9BACL
MHLVFLNSMERKTEGEKGSSAQVSICESQGLWQVLWNEPDAGGTIHQDVWYEGAHWDEMLAAFRYRLAEKMSGGFLPVIDATVHSGGQSVGNGRSRFTQMLYYYSEFHASEELFNELREWRRVQAGKEGKAPYIIASNRALKLLSAFVPWTKEELLMLPGFGTAKVEAYLEAIRQITVKHERSGDFPLGWVESQVDASDFSAWFHKQNEMKLKNEFDKKVEKRKLLEGIARGETLETLSEQLSVPRRDLITWIEELDKDGVSVDALVTAELAGVPDEEQTLAVQAFEKEGDRYLKPVLQHMYTPDQLGEKDVTRLYEWLRLLRIRIRKERAAA